MKKEGLISMLHTSRPSHMVDLSRVTSHWDEYLRKLNSCLYRFYFNYMKKILEN